LNGQTAFTYDENSRLKSLTDALTHATSYTYDTSDRVATRTDPLQKSATYQYDGNDHLTQLTDRKGQVTSYQYDALDRLTLVTYADTSTTAYAYDAGDRLTQVNDSVAGPITRAYDELNRLLSETSPEGTISYNYHPDGRRDTMTVTGQLPVTYGYDDAHRLTSITQGTSTVALAYDPADRRSTLTLPNAVVTTYDYDTANQLTGLTYTLGATTLGTLTYAYDAGGNRTTVGGTFARTGLPPALASATYDAANRIATWSGQTLSYDANGNLASDGLTSYTWNARNQLAGLSGAASASFAYDATGQRRARTTSGTTSYLYDGANAAQELVGGAVTATVMTGGVDEVFQRTDGAGTRGVLTDALGSTVALVDGSGALQTQYTYEPFRATSMSGAASANPAQFTGRENDGTGQYYYRARYYNPRLHRFLSEDPLEFVAGTHLYAYVNNDPVMYIDPFGLQPSGAPRSLDPEADFWFQSGQGSGDMWRNFRRMQDRNWQGADKYYHCMGNCQATNRGPGGAAAAHVISALRTWRSQYTEPDDWRKDQEANKCGQKGGDCEKLCAPFIPQSSQGKPAFRGW
jgi:RHS repeat-associated protein